MRVTVKREVLTDSGKLLDGRQDLYHAPVSILFALQELSQPAEGRTGDTQKVVIYLAIWT